MPPIPSSGQDRHARIAGKNDPRPSFDDKLKLVCRRKKSRCPGERPQCSLCARLEQFCVYAAPSGFNAAAAALHNDSYSSSDMPDVTALQPTQKQRIRLTNAHLQNGRLVAIETKLEQLTALLTYAIPLPQTETRRLSLTLLHRSAHPSSIRSCSSSGAVAITVSSPDENFSSVPGPSIRRRGPESARSKRADSQAEVRVQNWAKGLE